MRTRLYIMDSYTCGFKSEARDREANNCLRCPETMAVLFHEVVQCSMAYNTGDSTLSRMALLKKNRLCFLHFGFKQQFQFLPVFQVLILGASDIALINYCMVSIICNLEYRHMHGANLIPGCSVCLQDFLYIFLSTSCLYPSEIIPIYCLSSFILTLPCLHTFNKPMDFFILLYDLAIAIDLINCHLSYLFHSLYVC